MKSERTRSRNGAIESGSEPSTRHNGSARNPLRPFTTKGSQHGREPINGEPNGPTSYFITRKGKVGKDGSLI